MTSQTTIRQPIGAAVNFSLSNQTGTTTIRVTPNGTRFHLTQLVYGGADPGGGNALISLQIDGVTIAAFRHQNVNIGATGTEVIPLNSVHLGDAVEIIRLVGGAETYSLTLYGFDS